MTQATRRWPTADEMGMRLAKVVEAANPDLVDVSLAGTVDDPIAIAIADHFRAGGFSIERKISRLTEKILQALGSGVYGPLYEADGTTLTAVGQVWRDFKSVYNLETLEAVNEEGELLDV